MVDHLQPEYRSKRFVSVIFSEVGILHMRTTFWRELGDMALKTVLELIKKRLPESAIFVDILEAIAKLLAVIIICVGIVGVLLRTRWFRHRYKQCQ